MKENKLGGGGRMLLVRNQKQMHRQTTSCNVKCEKVANRTS